MTKNNSQSLQLTVFNYCLLIISFLLCVLILGSMSGCKKSKKSESSETEADTLKAIDSLAILIETKQNELQELDSIIKIREDSLSQRETALTICEQSISKINKKIDLTLKDNNAKLVELYEAMETSKVVLIINKLSDERVIKLLLSMKKRSSSRILEALPPDRTARITKSIMGKEK